jgi:hypothetical protein
MANDDKAAKDVPFIRFEVNMDVTVVIAWDTRVKETAWRKGFKETGEKIMIRERGAGGDVDRALPLMARDFPAGKVELGGPAADKCTAYLVCVIPKR